MRGRGTHVCLVNRSAHHYRPAASDRGRPLPRVGLYSATLGDDGSLLHVLASWLDGLVIAAFGVGPVPATWVARLSGIVTQLQAADHVAPTSRKSGQEAEIAERIPVMLASHVGAGFTAINTYGFAGSECDLIASGLIPPGSSTDTKPACSCRSSSPPRTTAHH